MKLLHQIVFLSATLTAVYSCGDSEETTTEMTTETLRLTSRKSICYAVGQRLCYSTLTESDERSFFYDSIDGFEFVWGASQDVVVEKQKSNSSAADASTYLYTLKSTNSITLDEVGSEYLYENIRLTDYTFTKEDGDYLFLGEKFECDEESYCDQLVELPDEAIVNVTFEYKGDGVISLSNWN